jgi:excisionase family DNA binding protein
MIASDRIKGQMMEDLLSVGGAADELGLSAVQVRRLARERKLPAQFIGGQWVIPRSAVARRRAVESAAGRPLSPPVAWVILGIVNDALHEADPQVDEGDRRKRYRLNVRLKSAPVIDRWPQWFSRRAEPHRVWVHPGRQERFASDARLHPAGAFAASRAGIEIVASKPERFYIKEADWPSLVKEFRLHDEPDGPYEFMVVPDSVPERLWPNPGEPAPLAVALVDMLESSESRDRAVAARSLAKVRQLLGRC